MQKNRNQRVFLHFLFENKMYYFLVRKVWYIMGNKIKMVESLTTGRKAT